MTDHQDESARDMALTGRKLSPMETADLLSRAVKADGSPILFSSLQGARKRAHDIHRRLTTLGVDIPLNRIQHAVARMARFDGWHALARAKVLEPVYLGSCGFISFLVEADVPPAYALRLDTEIRGAIPNKTTTPNQPPDDGIAELLDTLDQDLVLRAHASTKVNWTSKEGGTIPLFLQDRLVVIMGPESQARDLLVSTCALWLETQGHLIEHAATGRIRDVLVFNLAHPRILIIPARLLSDRRFLHGALEMGHRCIVTMETDSRKDILTSADTVVRMGPAQWHPTEVMAKDASHAVVTIQVTQKAGSGTTTVLSADVGSSTWKLIAGMDRAARPEWSFDWSLDHGKIPFTGKPHVFERRGGIIHVSGDEDVRHAFIEAMAQRYKDKGRPVIRIRHGDIVTALLKDNRDLPILAIVEGDAAADDVFDIRSMTSAGTNKVHQLSDFLLDAMIVMVHEVPAGWKIPFSEYREAAIDHDNLLAVDCRRSIAADCYPFLVITGKDISLSVGLGVPLPVLEPPDMDVVRGMVGPGNDQPPDLVADRD